MQDICLVCSNTDLVPALHPSGLPTPYKACSQCGFWIQNPPPQFQWESDEQTGSGKEEMTPYACNLNQDLANRLYFRFRPQRVLDIGSKYPYLLHCFKNLGSDVLGIDGCEGSIEFGAELGVPMVVGDFLSHDFGDQKFDLITLVHVVEHFTNPREALKKIHSLLTPNGAVYIRTPDISNSGIGIHLGPRQYQVHPVLFSTQSFRMLARQENFHSIDEWVQDAVGQTDWLLKQRKDVKISFAVIACSEEEVIGRMLDSIAPIAWELVVYLNNSTDRTRQIIEEWSQRTGIQNRIIDGPWKYNFGWAKNQAVLLCQGTHVAWMDCDDVLDPNAPDLILAGIEQDPECVQDWRLIYGTDTFFHCRLWPNTAKPFKAHFHDSCHEFVELGGHQNHRQIRGDVIIRHIPKPKDSAGRNKAILEKTLAEGPQPCPHCGGRTDERGRNLFYLGNSYRESGEHTKAIGCYDTYFSENLGWHDERFWARLYQADCYTALRDNYKAVEAACLAISLNSHWAEPYMKIANIRYSEKRYLEAISWCYHAASNKVPDTMMFLKLNEYRDASWRLISWCYEHLEDYDKAIEFAEVAKQKIGSPDTDWDNRIARLRSARADKSSVTTTKPICQVGRPGALGDIVMSTAACKGLQEQGYFVRYVCHPSSVDAIADNPYVDEIVAVAENTLDKILEHTARLPAPEKIILFQYPMNENYPNKPMRQHLSHFFCEQAGVPVSTDLSVGLLHEHLDYGAKQGSGAVLIHANAGWSALKNWPYDRWAELVSLIKNETQLKVVQLLGPRDQDLIPGAIHLRTPSLRHAVGVQQYCKVFVGVDSVFNHTSRAVHKRSVIIWGSTSPQGSGYEQNINIVNGRRWLPEMGMGGPHLKCQPCYKENGHMTVHPQPPCPNLIPYPISMLPESDGYSSGTLSACQASNSLEVVWAAIKELLSA